MSKYWKKTWENFFKHFFPFYISCKSKTIIEKKKKKTEKYNKNLNFPQGKKYYNQGKTEKIFAYGKGLFPFLMLKFLH